MLTHSVHSRFTFLKHIFQILALFDRFITLFDRNYIGVSDVCSPNTFIPPGTLPWLTRNILEQIIVDCWKKKITLISSATFTFYFIFEVLLCFCKTKKKKKTFEDEKVLTLNELWMTSHTEAPLRIFGSDVVFALCDAFSTFPHVLNHLLITHLTQYAYFIHIKFISTTLLTLHRSWITGIAIRRSH